MKFAAIVIKNNFLLEISEAAYRFLEYSSDFERSHLFFALTEDFS